MRKLIYSTRRDKSDDTRKRTRGATAPINKAANAYIKAQLADTVGKLRTEAKRAAISLGFSKPKIIKSKFNSFEIYEDDFSKPRPEREALAEQLCSKLKTTHSDLIESITCSNGTCYIQPKDKRFSD